MKLKNQQLNSFQVFVLPFIFIVVIIAIAFFVKFMTGRLDVVNKYKNVVPAQTISSNENLVTKLYFNTVLGEETALDPVVEAIHNAKHSIEIAMFSFDSDKVKNALYQAASKGIKITLVLDASRKDKHDIIFGDLPKSITRIDVGNFDSSVSVNTTYMHHKLLIIDRGFDTEQMITGSMDYTAKGEKYEQSFLLATSDKILEKVYEQEFDILKRKIHGKDKFLEKEYYPWAAHVTYPDSYVDVWFSPGINKNSVKDKILNEVSNARKSIDIIMWQFTDTSIADALIEKAKEGVKVRIISDDLTANDPGSVFPYIRKTISGEVANNIEIIVDSKSNSQINASLLRSGFNPFIHHHFMIIDNSTIILGTNNWSSWGFFRNDEDTLVTNNIYILNEFEKIFDHFYTTLK